MWTAEGGLSTHCNKINTKSACMHAGIVIALWVLDGSVVVILASFIHLRAPTQSCKLLDSETSAESREKLRSVPMLNLLEAKQSQIRLGDCLIEAVTGQTYTTIRLQPTITQYVHTETLMTIFCILPRTCMCTCMHIPHHAFHVTK